MAPTLTAQRLSDSPLTSSSTPPVDIKPGMFTGSPAGNSSATSSPVVKLAPSLESQIKAEATQGTTQHKTSVLSEPPRLVSQSALEAQLTQVGD